MKKVIRFLRSMQFGMILLGLIMALSLAGSLIPQQEAAMFYVRKYGSQTAMTMMALGATDIFHTWVFYGLLILLSLNLVFCSILRFPRTRQAAQRLFAEAERTGTQHQLTGDQLSRLRTCLEGRRYRTRAVDGGTVYYRNMPGFYGSFLTHLSILCILLFGSLVLMTPTVQDLTVMPGDSLTLEDGTKVFCESFHIENEQGNLDYASVLEVSSADGARIRRQEIRVNEPMRFGPYKIYQQTYGTAGRIRIHNTENDTEDLFYLTEACFLSIDGRNGIYFEALYPGYVVDEAGNYTLVTNTSGSYPDPVYQIQSISDGMSTSILAFPDESLTIGGIVFTFLSPAEYPGLRIKHVSTWMFAGLYASFALMVLALYLCFFMIPVCVTLREDGYAISSPKPQQGLELDIRVLMENS